MQLVGYSGKKANWLLFSNQDKIDIAGVTYKTWNTSYQWRVAYTGHRPVMRGQFRIDSTRAVRKGSISGLCIVDIFSQHSLFVELRDVPKLVAYMINNSNNGVCELTLSPVKKSSHFLRWQLFDGVFEATTDDTDVVAFWNSIS